MDAALKAIAEPRRRAILRLVWDAERSAGDIASHFEVSRPAISQHLSILRTAGLVTERRDGARRLYRADRDALQELQASLQAFWIGSLATLKEEVESDERRRRGRGRVHRQR
ncbi:MAG TPA: metalloregulator ArsR/SmtB family transcription factor [Actinomycetota bacterium]|nr:metalloregulator ArsR/SmtB family transcription factor [Actinomycetota bacterium]